MHSHEDLLTAFSLSAVLRLRRRFQAFAELYRQQRGNTLGEAVNRRNEKNVQQRRPPPAAETGRSCWGRGQQDTSAAQGTKWTLGTATRRVQRVEIAGGFLVLFCQQKRTLALNERALCPAPPARKAFQKPFLVLFWRAKENLTPLSSKTPATPSPSPPAHFRDG